MMMLMHTLSFCTQRSILGQVDDADACVYADVYADDNAHSLAPSGVYWARLAKKYHEVDADADADANAHTYV